MIDTSKPAAGQDGSDSEETKEDNQSAVIEQIAARKAKNFDL